ncbi:MULTISPECIES: hypothetical protein [unclassified Pseudomonas]|uniref:hypothetical protein n=1 Tax=unclassified Pseudomonas TaxID=196821 RepID=UPI0028937A4F|nr:MULTISPECIES: hypothetical protein [unclassified Pseudomonas]
MTSTENILDMAQSVRGTIKGTFKNLKTQITYDFLSDWVYRDTQAGKTRFHGTMVDPELADKGVSIGLELSSASEMGPEINWGDEKIVHLSLTKFYPQLFFRANSGRVKIQRHLPEDRINGSLIFTTVANDGDHYEIDVIYDIEAP